MTDNKKGYIIFLAAIGVMSTLLASDMSKLLSWDEVYQPPFVASVLAHLGTVIAAFVGGKLVQHKGE